MKKRRGSARKKRRHSPITPSYTPITEEQRSWLYIQGQQAWHHVEPLERVPCPYDGGEQWFEWWRGWLFIEKAFWAGVAANS